MGQQFHPVKVLGDRGEGHLGNVVMISAGGYTSAALKGDGTVWTWGRNDSGQLGIGTNEKPIGAPAQVVKGGSTGEGNYLTNVSTIAVGDNHMLAIQSVVNDELGNPITDEAEQQKVWGWGSNSKYQLTAGPKDDPYKTNVLYMVPTLQYATPAADGTQTHLHDIKTVEAG